ncbi:hypothetical protein FNV43_RR10446 [Rhamnella rubrinervis]|uniref:Uncharacterized protein n=1 Tax=Rhamnella rubrinervis TaxID=2594499 RepID=A0A8K0HD77_9ROSA|nr:hypothetical protein FNV43_RR10446 [Rhamnella rubrinervis]
MPRHKGKEHTTSLAVATLLEKLCLEACMILDTFPEGYYHDGVRSSGESEQTRNKQGIRRKRTQSAINSQKGPLCHQDQEDLSRLRATREVTLCKHNGISIRRL